MPYKEIYDNHKQNNNNLSNREVELLKFRFSKDIKSQKDAGIKFNLSKQRIDQIEKRALMKLIS
jgi:DNA-directed RNA polymerase sigma subunit (sigma70/sigma32)